MGTRSRARSKRRPSALVEEVLAAVPSPRPVRAVSRRPAAEPASRSKLTVSLAAPLAERFRALCREQGRPQRSVVEGMIRAYLARHGAEG